MHVRKYAGLEWYKGKITDTFGIDAPFSLTQLTLRTHYTKANTECQLFFADIEQFYRISKVGTASLRNIGPRI